MLMEMYYIHNGKIICYVLQNKLKILLMSILFRNVLVLMLIVGMRKDGLTMNYVQPQKAVLTG